MSNDRYFVKSFLKQPPRFYAVCDSQDEDKIVKTFRSELIANRSCDWMNKHSSKLKEE